MELASSIETTMVRIYRKEKQWEVLRFVFNKQNLCCKLDGMWDSSESFWNVNQEFCEVNLLLHCHSLLSLLPQTWAWRPTKMQNHPSRGQWKDESTPHVTQSAPAVSWAPTNLNS